MNFPGPWLHGPALQILLMFGGLRAGDLLKVSGVVGGYGKPYGVSKVGIVLESTHTKICPRLLLAYDDQVRICTNGNIRAWQRPPLDIEL